MSKDREFNLESLQIDRGNRLDRLVRLSNQEPMTGPVLESISKLTASLFIAEALDRIAVAIQQHEKSITEESNDE